jgi:DNA polymerase-3 subunit delta'
VIAVPDQPLAERVLRAALAREQPPQQLLLHGPAGTGKRAAARAVAWELVDPGREHGPDQESLDLRVVRPTGHIIRLEELDPALADLATRPVVGRRRAVIVEEAERLPDDAASRLLKTLEEPPRRSHVILVTDRVGDLLPTVRSRCLPVPFRAPGWRAVARRLEGVGIAAADAEGLARSAGTAALEAGPLALRARALGVELALGAIRGGGVAFGLVRDVQRAMEAEAAAHPSPELEELRRQAATLAGRRGERTALKRADDQAKREVRRAVTDGWAHVLDGASGLAADALAVAVGAESAVRHRDRLETLRQVAVPQRRVFLERVVEEIAATRAELALNPTGDLAMDALLVRIAAARGGEAGPLVFPDRLPA